MSDKPAISVVVIGRNEGARLARCLSSVNSARSPDYSLELIYVDSASTDGSVALAKTHAAQVISVSPKRPSAALGRNAGWRAASAEFILFLDGDTLLHPQFIHRALVAMNDNAVAVVWGHRREIRPEQSLFVKVLDLDWVYAPGDSEFCGGDALMRRQALLNANGFDETLIAGEEPEFCNRLRASGALIRHIDAPMTLHDLAIDSFRAYWRRAYRAGHAYAEVAQRCHASRHQLWRRESRRNQVHGVALLASPLFMGGAYWLHPLIALVLFMLGLLIIARSIGQSKWKCASLSTRFLYALHSHFQQIPILLGQLSFHWDQLNGHQRGLIEYKKQDSL